MKLAYRGVGYSWIACILLVGCASIQPRVKKSSNDSQLAVETVISEFRNYPIITPDAVVINQEIAKLCRIVTPEEAAQAVEQHGPHAITTILIHMNEPARLAYSSQANVYPVGSVIVKRKGVQEPDDPESGVGGMIKREPGYNPEHGDWEYFYFERRDRVDSGRLSKCIACHDRVSASDFVFGTWAPV